MAVNDRRLTGRDVLNKTFQAKTKRGYDPVEVDAYLELIAAQVDMLHGDVALAAGGAQPVSATATQAQLEELAALTGERDALVGALEGVTSDLEMARAENAQLREQVKAVAPPPPAGAIDLEPVVDTTETGPAHAAPSDPATVEVADKAAEESYELVLRMARRSAEETIAEAHARADEIVADANFSAAQISRESDRKAFEAANAAQAGLAEMNEQIDQRRMELSEIEARATEKRQELRDLANRILLLADEQDKRADGADVVDLRPQTTENV